MLSNQSVEAMCHFQSLVLCIALSLGFAYSTLYMYVYEVMYVECIHWHYLIHHLESENFIRCVLIFCVRACI